ncbi:MAG: gas vesicle protein GvpG [Actinoallomurus sp.]
MGLFTGILLLPLAPVRGVAWLAERLLEQAEQQMYDPVAIRGQLAEIEAAKEAGQLSEDEAIALENELLGRMMARRAEEAGR